MDDRSDFTVSIEVHVSDTDDNLHTDMKPPQMNSNERPDVEMPPELEIKESQVNLISKLMHVHLTGIVKLLWCSVDFSVEFEGIVHILGNKCV